MGVLQSFKEKLADAKDLTPRYAERKSELEEKKKRGSDRLKTECREQGAKDAQKSGLPATVFEDGRWCIYYPDGHTELIPSVLPATRG